VTDQRPAKCNAFFLTRVRYQPSVATLRSGIGSGLTLPASLLVSDRQVPWKEGSQSGARMHDQLDTQPLSFPRQDEQYEHRRTTLIWRTHRRVRSTLKEARRQGIYAYTIEVQDLIFCKIT
jgi:hypothetical protein